LRVAVAGVADNTKSAGDGGGVISRANVVAWLFDPEVPVSVIVAVPEVEFEAAVTVSFWAPPTFNINVAGETITPVGKPLTDTATAPLDPETALTVTCTVVVAPGAILTLLGVAVSEKSAVLEPPHPVSTVKTTQVATTDRRPQHPGIGNLTPT
jgi:hypothetical protein